MRSSSALSQGGMNVNSFQRKGKDLGGTCNPRLMTIYLARNTQTKNQVAFSLLYVETRLEL